LDERKVFTFAVPAERGHYYIAVLAEDISEAEGKISSSSQVRDIVKGESPYFSSLKEFTPLGEYPSTEALVAPSGFKERLERFGIAHRFIHKELPPYGERFGHRGFLPE